MDVGPKRVNVLSQILSGVNKMVTNGVEITSVMVALKKERKVNLDALMVKKLAFKIAVKTRVYCKLNSLNLMKNIIIVVDKK